MTVRPPIVSPSDTMATDGVLAGAKSEQVALVQPKLHVPRVPARALGRPRLVSQLCAIRRVALISAPAGFGKSTLLAQWTEKADRPTAWVTLDPDDSDPVRFWTHVLAALEQTQPQHFVLGANTVAFASTSDVVAAIVNGMCGLPSGLSLVLDDYHEVRSEAVDQSVERLIANLPNSCGVVLSSRRDPDLSLARWRASEELVEIRQRDLRFTEAEAADWLRSRSLDATPEGVQHALEVTEGWPAAFILAFGSGRAGVTRHANGDRRNVTEYIREEVVRGHDEDWPLLVVAALCPYVSASIVEHTLQLPGGGLVALRRLEQSDVLLERLDRSGEWYRLHRLVADHVLAGLDGEPEVRRWMVRAAEWFADNDHERTALDMLIQAQEHATACDMINRSWLQRWRSGQHATLRSDLARIDPAVAEQSASFLVTRAWMRARDGRAHDVLLDLERAGSVAGPGPLPDGCPSVDASAALIDALFAVRGLPTQRTSATLVDEMIDVSSKWRPLAELGIGYASLMAGDLSAASSAFARVLATTDPLLRSVAVGWDAVVDVLRGDLAAARRRLEAGAALWRDDAVLASLPAVVVGQAALDYTEGRPIQAAADLEACYLRLGPDDPTDKLEVLIWLAAAEVGIGRSNRARGRIGEATELIARLGGSPWHSQRLGEIEARMTPGTGRNGRDPGLTDREERILQLLSATHLSQREIGRELGISFNTIKSHVKAIYVKLGATSREEASQIARNRGLI